MEDQREDVDGLLADLAEKLEMKDAKPHEIALTFSVMMYKEFTQNRIKERIDTAIQFARISLRYKRNEPEITNRLLNNLGVFLVERYERAGDIADLEEAIQVTQQVIAFIPKDHSALAAHLSNFSNMLHNRYERTGNTVDVEEAIRTARQATTLKPKDHFNLALYLSNLGNALESRYKQLGDMANLEEAIQVTRQAVELLSNDHSNQALYLNNLGNNLARRYQWIGDMADIEEGIRIARRAVALTPEGYPALAGRLGNLGSKLQIRYEQTGDRADLEEAIEVAQRAVLRTPKDHSDLAIHLGNLGTLLESRYERGNTADLEMAIQVSRLAIALLPKSCQSLAGFLNNLGNMFGKQYTQTKDLADLKMAIQVTRQAIILTAKNHSDLAGRFNSLGNRLESLYQRTGDMAHLVEANRVFGRSWTSYSSAPFTRIYAASRCLKLLFHLKQYDEAAEIAVSVTDLLPIVNARSLDRNDRQHVVSRFAGIAVDACGVLLQARDPETALQYLEKGRAVVLGQMIDSWSDLSFLRKTYPELATKFKVLCDTVNARSGHLSAESDQRLVAQRRRAAAAELELCIQSIQGVPGQELFMAAQSIQAMQACALGGYIVIVNMSPLRSDVIIVSPTSIRTIRLPSLSVTDVETWIGKQWHGPRSERGAKNKEYSKFLKWLWEWCVKRVLDSIGSTKSVSNENLPRIWWIGTGFASSMPFHAAGDHSPDSTENTFNYVISSYAPSIKALSYSKSRSSVDMSLQLKALIATMPVTPGIKPGLDRLPGVLDEKKSVMEILRRHTTVEEIEQPSTDAVIHSLKGCNIAHFACHGRTNNIDPSRSGLILQRKDESGSVVQDVLTVHDLSEINLQHAQLAYLSACSTAENKAVHLADEVIHVVSGFEVAGFAHVIGCLWPSGDRECVEVARGFYGSLVEQGVLRLQSGVIAAALHTSVMEVRAKAWKQPLNWAQFVHYGA